MTHNSLRKIVSLILASIIVLTLLYSLTTRVAYAQVPADAVQINPSAINWKYPTHVPGEKFSIYIDVINVNRLFVFQTGFRFNATVLQVLGVYEGGFLSNNGNDPVIYLQGKIDNVNGIVTRYGCWRQQNLYEPKTGSGHLLRVDMMINPALSPPYSGTYPGSPVVMVDLSSTGDIMALKLWEFADDNHVYEVTPSPDHIYGGTFTLTYSIPANVDINPNTMNLRSNGNWITGHVELPEGYDIHDIDTASIKLNDTISALPEPISIGDYDNNGVPDLMVKFDRQATSDLILENYQFEGRFGTVTLTVIGKLKDGTPFQGSDTIKVILPIPAKV